jgi:OmpA-OmpF porin, OOP family
MKAVLAILFFPVSFLGAQNLVVNPDFESRNLDGAFDVNNGFKSHEVDGWYQPSLGTSDYFIVGDGRNGEKKFMTNVCGQMEAHSGEAFAGFYGMGYGGYVEYIGGTLSQPLVAGKKYKISMALALGSGCARAVTELGIHFSENRKQDSYQLNSLPYDPQVKITGTSGSDIGGKWQILTAEFLAAGNEKYFIVGNFNSDYTELPGGEGKNPWSYYLIDDVSVSPADKPSSVNLSVPGTNAIAPGKTLVSRSIYFETDRAVLLAASYPQLYSILAALKEQPDLKVEIDGHTDTTGETSHNLRLSEARAKAVAEFFISNGIDPSRITWKGFGSSKPVSPTDNALNRRVEFIFSE